MLIRNLNDALEALLYRTSAREAFFAGDIASLGVTKEDAEALRSIDPEQLVAAANMARHHVLNKSHRGVGSLLHVFRETIGAWQGQNPGRDLDELAADFVESSHFGAHRAHAFGTVGIGLEEAFLRFATEDDVGIANIRFRECAVALLRGLCVTPSPTFLIPTFLTRAPKGFFVVLPDGPTLLAALGGKLVEGPITPYVAEILASKAAGVPSDDRGGVTAAEREALEDELVRLGLLASCPPSQGPRRSRPSGAAA